MRQETTRRHYLLPHDPASDLGKEDVGVEVCETDRLPLVDHGRVGQDTAETKGLAAVHAEGVSDGKDLGCLRGAGLDAPAVEGVPGDAGLLVQPSLALPLLSERLDDRGVEGRGGRGLCHVVSCSALLHDGTVLSPESRCSKLWQVVESRSMREKVDGQFLSMAETGKRLRLSRWTVRKLVRSGELQAVKGPARNAPIKVYKASVDDYLARRRISPPLSDVGTEAVA